MVSKTTIYNMALLHVGATTIASTTDNAKGVRVLDQFYETVRDRIISGFPWNFARAQAELSQLATAPSFGYACAYQLPTDCLSVVKISQPGYDFRVVSGQVLECDYDDSETGAASLYLDYVQRVSDESLFSPHFANALAFALAVEIAVPMSGKVNLMDYLNNQAARALIDAQAEDWKNDTESTKMFDATQDTWITGRA